MYVSCSSCVQAHREFPEAIARIAELGFRYVDLLVIEGMKHLYPSDLVSGRGPSVPEIASLLRGAGLRVSSLNCGFSRPLITLAQERGAIEREFQAMLALAAEVECGIVSIGIGTYSAQTGRVECFDRVLEGLEWLASRPAAKDFRICFEPHSGSPAETPADAIYLAKRVWPNVGIAYDPSHFVMHPEFGPLADSEPLLQYTVHVHVRNAAPGRMQTPMAEGCTDFPWLLASLRRRGYDEAVAIEYLDGAEEDALALREVLTANGVKR
jgi:sugar phosphate isomerase/epimerase